MTPTYFIFDVESVGLHGEGFAVAGGIYDSTGERLREFAYHCPTWTARGGREDRAWVEAHVTTSPLSVRLATPMDVREAFWREWVQAKEGHPGIAMWVECGWPVEANFLAACVAGDTKSRSWQGPYPLHEIATAMLGNDMDPMASYTRLPDELPAHEPLADSRLSARLLFSAMDGYTPLREARANLSGSLDGPSMGTATPMSAGSTPAPGTFLDPTKPTAL